MFNQTHLVNLSYQYESRMTGQIEALDGIETDLGSIASHSSTCEALRTAYDNLESADLASDISTPRSYISTNIIRLQNYRSQF